jgi:hypothetical protein
MFTAKGDVASPLSADAPHVTEQPATSFAVGFSQEPPLSPPTSNSVAPLAPAPDVLRAPEPVAQPAPIVERPILPVESLLLRFRMISPDQLAEAMKEEAVNGKPVGTIVVEKGWVSEADMARLSAPDATPVAAVPAAVPAAAPEPVAAAPEPAPVAEAAPAPAAEVAPAPVAAPTGVRFQILVHLTNGERVEIATADDAPAAKAAAHDAMQKLRNAAEWPLLAGRYVRPDAIVSIDVAALLA